MDPNATAADMANRIWQRPCGVVEAVFTPSGIPIHVEVRGSGASSVLIRAQGNGATAARVSVRVRDVLHMPAGSDDYHRNKIARAVERAVLRAATASA